jgi:ATP-dependent helicase/nuclease subunit B
MVGAGGIDPVARSLLERATTPALHIDTDVDPAAPFRDVPTVAPAFHVCDGFEDEAAATAAQVLVHVERGDTPVALIAQDRALVRASARCSSELRSSCVTRPAGGSRRRGPVLP